jgi:predicted transcriptional regulator YdeE
MRFEHVDEFQVVGVASRTSNAREMTPDGVIPKLWEQMARQATIALYTEYETDEHGEYTFVLGGKSGSATGIPEGLTLKTVPSGRYAVFTSARGPVQKVVIETWLRIWSELPSAGNLRSYLADFEVYNERASDPASAVVEIYVGVK